MPKKLLQEDVRNQEDYSKYYKTTEYPMRDAVYNALIRKHKKRGKPWTTEGFFSDAGFWNATIYHVWDWIPSLLYIYVTYFLVNWTYDRYGAFRGASVLAVMVLLRINALVRQQALTNRLLKKQLEKLKNQ